MATIIPTNCARSLSSSFRSIGHMADASPCVGSSRLASSLEWISPFIVLPVFSRAALSRACSAGVMFTVRRMVLGSSAIFGGIAPLWPKPSTPDMVEKSSKIPWYPRYPQAKIHAKYVISVSGKRLVPLSWLGVGWGSSVDRFGYLFLVCSCMAWAGVMAIKRQIKQRYATRNEEIVARLRESAGAGPPIDPRMAAKRKIAEAATLLALVHGGDWRVQFEPENDLVMIARRL
ncbi:MAG: hypothetical protein ACTHJQ_22045 [Rhizobiaceae bacterium]